MTWPLPIIVRKYLILNLRIYKTINQGLFLINDQVWMANLWHWWKISLFITLLFYCGFVVTTFWVYLIECGLVLLRGIQNVFVNTFILRKIFVLQNLLFNPYRYYRSSLFLYYTSCCTQRCMGFLVFLKHYPLLT
jgi:hypothetical protein